MTGRRKHRKHTTAGILAVSVMLALLGGALLLSASATPGPPTYIPSEPSGDDSSRDPGESGDESSSEEPGGQFSGPPQYSSSPEPSQSSVPAAPPQTSQPYQSSDPSPSQPSTLPESAASSQAESLPSASSSTVQSAVDETSQSTQPEVAGGSAVTTFSQFKAALEGADGTVRLGGDVTMEESITLAAGRSVTIDGSGFTISEGAAGHSIQAGDKSKVIVRNAKIEGYDVMGFVGASGGSDKVITFDSVTYNGPQLCHNAASGDSRVIIQNCEINITSRSGTASEELVQCSWVELAGNTSISQSSARSATFHLEFPSQKKDSYGGADRGVIIRKDARVSIEASDYMLRGNGAAFVMEDNAYFRYTAPDGGNYGTDNGLAYLDIGPNASFFLVQEGSNGHNPNRELTMAADSTFKLGRGSVFEVTISDTQESTAALDFRGVCAIQITAPKRMLLSCSGGVITADSAAPVWQISGINALNYWDAQGGRYIWNDHSDGLSAFGFQVGEDGELSGAPESVKDLRGLPLAQSPVVLYGDSAQQLVLGSFEGALAVESWTGPITGFAATGASLTAAYYTADGKVLSPISGEASGEEQTGGNSAYSVALPDGEAPADSALGLVAEQENLLVQRSVLVERVEGGGGAAASGEGAKLRIDGLEKVDGSVEATLRLEDSAGRGWRIMASDADGGETAYVVTYHQVGDINTTRTDELSSQELRIRDIPAGEQSAATTVEILLPAKADGSVTPKTVRWTMVLPVD